MLRHDWLALTPEEALDPDLPICDAHHHLWHGGPDKRERYLIEELTSDLASGHNIVSTVFVECHAMYRRNGPEAFKPVGEVEFANGIAAMSASGQYGNTRVAAGIVGAADLTLGRRVAPVLDAQLRASQRFRGVRYSTCWDAHADELMLWKAAPAGLLNEPVFREGLACLEERGLVYDAWMLFPQLPELVRVARAMPGLQIVLGHIGGLLGVGPYADMRETYAVWARYIADVASCPNVKIKLGGIGIRRLGFGWDERAAPPDSIEMASTFEPYVLHCIEKFGVDRCMFESNYPADGRSASFTSIWNAFKRMTRGFSSSERAALFRDTASTCYRLDDSPA